MSTNKGIQVFGGNLQADQLAVGKGATISQRPVPGSGESPILASEAPAKKLVALFLAANPPDNHPLKLDEEAREITAKISSADCRDAIEFVTRWAVRPDDLLQALNEVKPSVVHFSGHGSKYGEIILAGPEGLKKPVSKAALISLFDGFEKSIRAVVLNACYSQVQAEGITQVIDCAITMSGAIGDEAAIIFSASFYRALAFGHSLQASFDQGKTALLLEGILEDEIPSIIARPGVDLTKVVLVSPGR